MTERVLLMINKIDWMLAENVVLLMKARFPGVEFALAATKSTVCISALNMPSTGILTFMAVQMFGEGILSGMNILEHHKEYEKYQNN